jgi:hypothetical protein
LLVSLPWWLELSVLLKFTQLGSGRPGPEPGVAASQSEELGVPRSTKTPV